MRQHPVAYLDLIDRKVDRLLSAGLIERCNSTYASNVVLVKRKLSPDAPPGSVPRLRLTVDYRHLNLKLKRLSYPMPSASLILDSSQGHHRFTTLDFSNAYLSVKLDEETNYLAAFITRRGMFTFRRLGAGLASAPAIFNQLIQSLFSDMLWTHVLAFLDDLTLPSRTIDEGIELLSRVLCRLEGAGLKLKASKCKLLQSKVKILGVIVSAGQLCEDESRAKVVQSISFPRTAKELRSLLGFCNFGRSFYKDFAAITAHLTDCLKKGARIERNAKTLEAFERLKEIMTSPPVLTMFDPSARHIVEADSSGTACGAVLLQIGDDGVEKIVAFASRTLSDVQRRWCTTRKELYAIIFALQHWRHYLIGRKIGVRSDHSCLQYLLTSKMLTNQWSRYLDFLADFELELVWKPGREQKLSDFLSRFRPCESDGASPCKQCRPKGGAGGVETRDLIDCECDESGTGVVRRTVRASSWRPLADDDRVAHNRTVGSDRGTSVRSINASAPARGVSADGTARVSSSDATRMLQRRRIGAEPGDGSYGTQESNALTCM